MRCTKCGAEVEEGDDFCTECGTKQVKAKKGDNDISKSDLKTLPTLENKQKKVEKKETEKTVPSAVKILGVLFIFTLVSIILFAIILTWGKSFSQAMQPGTEEDTTIPNGETSTSQLSQSETQQAMEIITEENTEVELACTQDVKFELKNVCSSSGENIKLTVYNNGNMRLEGISANFKMSSNQIFQHYDITEGVGLDAFGSVVYEINVNSFDFPLGTNLISQIKEVELIPDIKVGDIGVTCLVSIARYGDTNSDTGISSC